MRTKRRGASDSSQPERFRKESAPTAGYRVKKCERENENEIDHSQTKKAKGKFLLPF
jgi:hypothetical protein